MADSKKQRITAIGKDIKIDASITHVHNDNPLTSEQFKRIIQLERKDAIEECTKASDAEKVKLEQKIAELDRRLADVPKAFQEFKERIARLESILEREGNEIGNKKLMEAREALEKGDFSKADAIFAEIETREQLAVERSARAAYARGEIAEQEVRWKDAAEHYTRAAQLAPCFETLIKAQNFALATGNYNSAVSLGLDAQKAAINEYGEDSEEHANSLNNLAGIYYNQGQIKKAEQTYEHAIKINKELLGEEHLHTITSFNNLAEIYQKQGHFEKAESLHKKVLGIRKKALGKNHISVATSLNNLAGIYYEQGLYKKAEGIYQTSLNICKKTLGEKHPITATNINNLGGICQVQKKYKEAEAFHKKSLEIRIEVLGDKHPDTATSISNLGEIYHNQKNYEKAKLFHNKALKIYQESLGIDHNSTAISLNNLGGVYLEQRNYEKSESFYKQALEIRKKNLGTNHHVTANSFNNLAVLYQETKQYDKAESLCKQALQIFESNLGHEHPITKLIRTNYELIKKALANTPKTPPK